MTCRPRRWWAATGSIDWLCLPRFDSPACFAALDDERAGRWLLAPAGGGPDTRRRYRGDSLVTPQAFSHVGLVNTALHLSLSSSLES